MRKKMKKFLIQNYEWKVDFVELHNMPTGSDGITLYNERKILIRNDLDRTTTACVLRHELTHAILCVQGRWNQKTFTQEELCEFIGFQAPTISQLVDKITKEKEE